jgi:hypothetical protein
MRITTAFAVLVIGSVAAAAQGPSTNPNCFPIRQNVQGIPDTGELFLLGRGGIWNSIPRTEPGVLAAIFGPQPYSLHSYADGSLHFIYVAGRDSNDQSHGRSFLAVRVTSLTKDASGIVNLRRQRVAVPRGIQIGAYQDYHRRGFENSSILSIFHSWHNPSERSDVPFDVREAYAFREGSSQAPAIRRVLSIGYFTSSGRRTCVPFSLGPHLLANEIGYDPGNDPIYLPSPFNITVTEAKTSLGHSGASFHLQGTP